MRLLVLGLGNVLLGDDGLGVRAIEMLASRFRAPEGVELVDGGTLGLGLLAAVADADTLIFVDAIAADAAPGSLVRIEGDQVPPAVLERLSPHQIGVADLLQAAKLIDRYPERVVLCGLVPQSMELSVELSAPVLAAMPRLIDTVVRECVALGYPLEEAA